MAEWACLQHMLVKVSNPSKNVQVSCSLLELSGRHVIVLQVKVPQISFIICGELHRLHFCPKLRLLLIAHACVRTHHVPVWQMGLAKLEVLLFFVTVQELCVRRQVHALLQPAPSLMKVAPEVYHLHLQKRQCALDKQQVYHLRLRPVLMCEMDLLIFAPIEQKLHVSSGEQIAHVILAGTQDSSSPTQYVPLWRTQLEQSTNRKLDV